MIKNLSFIAMIVIIIFILFNLSDKMPNYKGESSGEYYLKNSLQEVEAKNVVTGIYLDYRYFDTIFEASILLITVNGILYLSKFDQF